MICETCNGTGWVCEAHLDTPADMDAISCSIAGCGGAVCNCLCNPNGEYEFEAVYASTQPSKVKKWVQ